MLNTFDTSSHGEPLDRMSELARQNKTHMATAQRSPMLRLLMSVLIALDDSPNPCWWYIKLSYCLITFILLGDRGPL